MLYLRLRLLDGVCLRVQRGARLRVRGIKLRALLLQGFIQALAGCPNARQFRQPLRSFVFQLGSALPQRIQPRVRRSQRQRALGALQDGLLRRKGAFGTLLLLRLCRQTAGFLVQLRKLAQRVATGGCLLLRLGKLRCLRLLRRQLRAHGGEFFGGQQPQGVHLRLQGFHLLARCAQALVGGDGKLAVNFRAGDLFQNRAALIRPRLQEGGKTALGKQHGAGEALKIQPGDGFDARLHVFLPGFQHLTAVGIGDFVARRLQRAVRLFARALLAPMAAPAAMLGFKGDFGKTFAGLPREDFVGVFADFAQPGRAAVKRQTDGVEHGGFARAGRPGEGKQPVLREGRVREVNVPRPGQRIEVLKADVQDAHGMSIPAARSSSSNSR